MERIERGSEYSGAGRRKIFRQRPYMSKKIEKSKMKRENREGK